MNINELALKDLSSTLGIDEAKLKAELTYDGATAPTETKVKDLLATIVVMPKKDHDTLLDNHGKNKFDEGKFQSLEQLVKVALGDKSFPVTKEMKREDVAAKMKSVLETDWTEKSGKAPDAKVKELQDSITKLQTLVSEKENELNTTKSEFEKTKTFSTAKEKVISAVSSIPFESTGEILNKQREVVIKNILSSYQHKIEDGVSVWYDIEGKRMLDKLQNPMTIEEIAKGEAIIFPQTKASNGRGDNSSNPNKNKSGELDAELAKCSTALEVGQLLTKRGLSVVNEDGRAVLKQWTDAQNKKTK